MTDAAGNVFACGETMSSSGIATCNAVQLTWGNNKDIFIALFSETASSTTVSINISSPLNGAICAGLPAIFSAIVLNCGSSPVYQWKVNGVNTGMNNPVFTSSSLNNEDVINCVVTSNSPCISNPIANSNSITVSITSSVVPAVTIASSASGPVCASTTINFTAVPVNGGTTPLYQWRVNGSPADSNNASFSSNTLVNGDAVSGSITNTASCNPVTT